jgi:hypothetical protein
VPGVIDGRHWLRQRIATLEEALQAELTADQRAPIEAELTMVRAELARRRGWRHWLLWGTPPPS